MPAQVPNHSAELRAGAFLAIAGGVLNVVSNAVQPSISDYANTTEVLAALPQRHCGRSAGSGC